MQYTWRALYKYLRQMNNMIKSSGTVLASIFVFAAFGQTPGINNQNEINMQPKKVLFVVTSADEAGTTGKKTGLWIEEFATPYYLLTDQGIEVTIASPKGGQSPIDPKSALPQYSGPSVKRFYGDPATEGKLARTVKLESVNAADYDAVFYPGGHGPMWDLPENKASIQLIELFYQQGKPIAFVCHAPAVLKNVTDGKGKPLIKDKKVTGYSNSEETAGNTVDMTPFLLEDMLKSKGADYTKGEDWHPFVAMDGQLITGQNPASAGPVAEKILSALTVPAATK
jgi:putative intracellular protease/amidase